MQMRPESELTVPCCGRLMLQSLVRDLKASLTYMIAEIGTASHLLLWLLSVGGITAHSMPERAWFVGHLVVVITDLDIST